MDYFLTSPRLGFRCWTEEDFSLATDLWGDPNVSAFIGGPFTPEEVRSRLTHEIGQMKRCGLQYWPFFLRKDQRHVGCAGLRPYEAEGKVFEFGVHLRPSFWGQGLASEASRTVIDYAFRVLSPDALFAGHHPLNAASRQLSLNLGFVYTHDELYPPTGLMHLSYLLRQPTKG